MTLEVSVGPLKVWWIVRKVPDRFKISKWSHFNRSKVFIEIVNPIVKEKTH
jgi:hypothetical protein